MTRWSPGLLLAVGSLELLRGALQAGAARFMGGIFQLILLAFGLVASEAAFDLSSPTHPVASTAQVGAWAAVVGVGVYTVGLWLAFSAPLTALPALAVVVYAAWGIQQLADPVTDRYVSTFLAATVGVVIAQAIHAWFGPPPLLTINPLFRLLGPGGLSLERATALTVGNFLGGVVVAIAIVGADHEHHDLGLNPIEFATLHAPQDVLRSIPADAEVGGLQWFKFLGKNLITACLLAIMAFAAPGIGDGIAQEQYVNPAIVGHHYKLCVALHPAKIRLFLLFVLGLLRHPGHRLDGRPRYRRLVRSDRRRAAVELARGISLHRLWRVCVEELRRHPTGHDHAASGHRPDLPRRDQLSLHRRAVKRTAPTQSVGTRKNLNSHLRDRILGRWNCEPEDPEGDPCVTCRCARALAARG